MLRILFAGSGTGGHITPIIAVAEELKVIAAEKSIELEMRYFGQPGIYEELLYGTDIQVSKISSSKWRRYFDLRNLFDVPKFFISIFQLLWRVFWFMPNVLFSKGGAGVLAVVLVCRFYRIPIIIHESDSIPGLNNLISGRFAKRIAISFDEAKNYFSENVALTGTPIRRLFLKQDMEQIGAKRALGFDVALPLILFMGGSQGATRINDFVLDILPELLKNFQVLHQTGIQNFEEVKKEFGLVGRDLSEGLRSRYKPAAYLENNLKEAMAAADIVVSRAGSTSIFEIAAMGKPSILIPLPEAAQDHQVKNAYEYARTGAAIVIEADNLTPNIFLSQIKALIADNPKLKAMSEAARNFAKPEAAKVIAEEIISLS